MVPIESDLGSSESQLTQVTLSIITPNVGAARSTEGPGVQNGQSSENYMCPSEKNVKEIEFSNRKTHLKNATYKKPGICPL